MIRAEIRFKNAVFMNALEKSKYNSIAELSRVSGIAYQNLISFASLKWFPKDINVQIKIAEFLDCGISELFEQYEEIIHKNKGNVRKLTVDIPTEKIISLSSNKLLDLESDYDTSNIDNELSLQTDVLNSLKTLKVREKDIIELHFGINKDRAYSIKEIGIMYNISKERVRQIKEKAIRRLKHKSRSTRLAEYMCKKDISGELAGKYRLKHSRDLEKERREEDELLAL